MLKRWMPRLMLPGMVLACPLLAGAAVNQPTGLLCELMAHPERTTITDTNPDFGWIVNSPTGGDRQIGYRILVASSPEWLAVERGDMWDTGQVASARSISVEYGGKPLKPGASYWWKVRTTLAGGAEPRWSAPQRFNITSPAGAEVEGGAPADLPPPVRAAPHDRYLPVTSEVKPAAVRRLDDDHWFVDFGKAAFGKLKLTLTSPRDATIAIHLGEERTAGGRVNRKPGGTRRYKKLALDIRQGTHTYDVSMRPYAPGIDPPRHIGEVMPFRYVEIDACPAPLSRDAVTQVMLHYPFDDDASSFNSSDDTLNAVWDLCKYSIKATSFLGIYVDGDRERKPYEADAYINQLCHYSVDREFTMARYSHEYLIEHPTWPTEWILHSVLMAWADYMHTGDAESLAKYYDDLKAKTLHALARPDGLIATKHAPREVLRAIHRGEVRDIVDWPRGERDRHAMPEVNTVVNAFHYRAMVLMGRIAGVLDQPDDARFFTDRARRVRETFNAKLFDADRGVYVDGLGSDHAALHSSMFALALGLVPEDRVDAVVRFIKSRGMACSVYGAQYLLEGLYDAGADDYALSLLTSRSDRSWWNMIRQGSTISMEAWGNQFKKNQDWNHAWGAAPANLIPRRLLGVTPLEPGFGRVRIKPQPGSLAHAAARVPTIRGPIHVSVDQREGERFTLDVTIPCNVTAEVMLPAPRGTRVRMNDAPVQAGRQGEWLVIPHVASGSHRFVVHPER